MPRSWKTPPYLLGAVLIFWGSQTGLLFVGLALAVVVESPRFIPVRWQFSLADFHRIYDFCTLLFVGALVYAFASNDGITAVRNLLRNAAPGPDAFIRSGRSVLTLAQWMPMILFPMMLAQAFSHQDRIAWSAFSWVLRWQRDRRSRSGAAVASEEGGLHFSFPYFALCIFSSSAAKGSPLWFFPCISLLLSWALWTQRPKRFSPAAWVAGLVLIVGLGAGGTLGLHGLQQVLERIDTSWLVRFGAKGFNPKESRTMLGSIGRLKLSGRIVLRVDAQGQPPPLLLREASYNVFKSPLWHASDKEFRSVLPETNETTWILLPEKKAQRSVTISRYLEGGLGLLALPNGSSQLEELPVFLLSVNPYGALKVGAGPGLVTYVTRYDEGETVDGPPGPEDLEIPTAEGPALSQVMREIDLASPPPEEAVRRLQAYFQNHFRYASYLETARPSFTNQTALAQFLLQTRAGHCEYFATATTLLLRKVGIPARYAVGYSVQEAAGKKYVVRERHGHAWCLVYLGGHWRDLDTTPDSWNALESKQASFWEPLSDLWSRLWFEFSKWRWSRAGVRQYILWFVLALLLVAAARLFFKKQWRQFQEAWRKAPAAPSPGLDSEFYLIERRLREKGLERQPGETLTAWIQRLRAPGTPALEPLGGILHLHYRYRFDPAGLSEPERADLAERVRQWLAGNPL